MTWPRTLPDLLRIEHPILQAPMAGVATPDLVAAVSDAGALGSLGGGYLAPDALRREIRAVRARTTRPFGVNLFASDAPPRPPDADEARATAAVAPLLAQLGLRPPARAPDPVPFADRLAVVLDEAVPVFSFTFGALGAEDVAALARRGAVVIGTATSVAEARALAASGAAAIVAQGAEAGGHRGTFLGPPERALVGTIALVPAVVDAVRVPVLAAGGIMDGRGVAAALALGAAGAVLGTAFLACAESGAARAYRDAVRAAPADEDGTVLTRAFSGRLARALSNRLTDALASAPVLPYPWQNGLTAELRQAAGRAGRADLMSLYAGQGAARATSRTAGEIVAALVDETRATLERLGFGS